MFDLTTTSEDFIKPEDQLRVLTIRIQMAQAYVALLEQGFAAHVNFGVNYKNLPSFLDTDLLDEVPTAPTLRGQELTMEWMRRVSHDINAAIRRKQFRKV